MSHDARPHADQRAALTGHFDAAFYREEYPDVVLAGLSALDHFMITGWREGRNPSRWFDVSYYLKMNVDVAASGLNPLLHYVWAGRNEGRSPCRALDSERRQLQAATAPHDRVPEWAHAQNRTPPMSLDLLLDIIQASLGGPACQGLMISVSHDDYALHYGGVQKLIVVEQDRLALAGWRYLHISPAATLPILATNSLADTFGFALRLNGEAIGTALARDVLAACDMLRQAGCALEIAFHHLMGHSPELLARLASLATARPMVWVHDFFALCPSYALMRNDICYCAAPSMASAGCAICVYGDDRAPHIPRVEQFFRDVRPAVLAPSQAALDVWLKSGLSHSTAAVIPIARLLPGDTGPHQAKAGRSLRIAHVGARALFKGWAAFEALAHAFADDPRYKFYQLGVDGHVSLPGCICHVPVRVSMQQPDAMIEAVAANGIDVVVSWSLWPETFCFAVHEALAGGAYVLARSAAGNVPRVVLAHSQGLVLNGQAELHALFSDGAITELVRNSPRRYSALIANGGSADWMLGTVGTDAYDDAGEGPQA